MCLDKNSELLNSKYYVVAKRNLSSGTIRLKPAWPLGCTIKNSTILRINSNLLSSEV